MYSIKVRNVSEGLVTCLTLLEQVGVRRESRNGSVIAFPEPFSTTYLRPAERVLCSPVRRANPIFHLLESIWMLAGRDDVKFPALFVKRMLDFSDDTFTLHGAYGYRWRHWFGWDQIHASVDELRKNPTTRRVVIDMWDPGHVMDERPGGDFHKGVQGGKDVPCNTHIYLDTRDGNLNMLVSCRSNDILWGCFGANAVHMSMLQEYVAASLGVEMGWYTQMSNDLHMYEEHAPAVGTMMLAQDVYSHNIYRTHKIHPTPILQPGERIEDLDSDIDDFFSEFDRCGDVDFIFTSQYHTDFFNFTIAPMLMAWGSRKDKTYSQLYADQIQAQDWCWATREWLGGTK